MCGTLHTQRYDQLHAEETATQRVKGQGDVLDDSAMDRGRERSTRTHFPQMLFYLVGLTLSRRAAGGETGNVNEGTAMPHVTFGSHRGILCRSTAS